MTVLRAVRRVAIATAISLTAFGSGAATAAAGGTEQVYSGDATITISTYDYCDLNTGGRHFVGEQSYTAAATMVVSDPISDGEGGAEQNPIHFTLQSDQQTAIGAFSLTSAQVFTTPQTDRQVALTYWSTTYDSTDGNLQAQLVEDNIESAAAYNLVNVEQQLVPCRPQLGTIPMVAAMAEGAQLDGTLDDSDAVIELVATSTDGLYDFRMVTDLTRTN
jgi:hypothetical protein